MTAVERRDAERRRRTVALSAQALPNCIFSNARKLSGESVIESLEKHGSLASIAKA